MFQIKLLKCLLVYFYNLKMLQTKNKVNKIQTIYCNSFDPNARVGYWSISDGVQMGIF